MAVYDPGLANSPAMTYHGTFNNISLATYVGHAGLSLVYTPDVCRDLNAMSTRLQDRLAEVTKGTKMCFTGIGSILGSHFTDEGLQTLERETKEDWILKALFWLEMMEDGFWIARLGTVALILGTTEEELGRFVRCVAAFLQRHKDLVRVG